MAATSSQHHSFDIRLAAYHGVDGALLIHHFQHWVRINRRKNTNIHDGRCWTYQSRKDIAAHFPYWSDEQIRHSCEKLVKAGVLVTANYNKASYDKTLWYAFADEKAFQVDAENSNSFYVRENSHTPDGADDSNNSYKGNFPNGCGKFPKPIPDTKTDTKKEVVCPTPPVGSSVSKITKKTAQGKEISLQQSDFWHFAVRAKKKWSPEVIADAWTTLAGYDGPVNDLMRFLEGTADNLQNKNTFEKHRKVQEKKSDKKESQPQYLDPRDAEPKERVNLLEMMKEQNITF